MIFRLVILLNALSYASLHKKRIENFKHSVFTQIEIQTNLKNIRSNGNITDIMTNFSATLFDTKYNISSDLYRINSTCPIAKIISENKNNRTSTSEHKYSTLSLLQNNTIQTDTLLNLIDKQAENIQNEICSSCLGINKSLDFLIEEIRLIKSVIIHPSLIAGQHLPGKRKKEIIMILLKHVNQINLIKADLFKLNELLSTLQKANCKNYSENSQKYFLVVESTNKLIELLQTFIQNLHMNVSIMVLN